MIVHNYIDEKPPQEEEVVFIRKDLRDFGFGFFQVYTTCEPGSGEIEDASVWTGVISLIDERGSVSAVNMYDAKEYPYWISRGNLLTLVGAMTTVNPDNIVDYISTALAKTKEDPIERFDLIDLE